MPYFSMIGWDGPSGTERRDRNREAHLSYMRALDQAGRILLGGPLRDEADQKSRGAVIMFEAENLTAAKEWVSKDPYVLGGVYEIVAVNTYKPVFPEKR